MLVESRGLIWVLMIVAFLAVFIPLLMWSPMGGYMMGMEGMMGFGWGYMFLIPIAFLVFILVGAYYLITELTGPTRNQGGNAIEILKERYAKGEITKDQYDEMRRDIEK